MKLPARILIVIGALLALTIGCGQPPATPAPTQPPPPPGTEPPATEPPATEPPATAPPTEPSATAGPCTPDSEFVGDITIPDGTLVSPGETFTKTWRISNDGDCPWTPEFTWEQIDASGNLLQATTLVMPIPSEVPPGGTLDISVQLTLSGSAMLGNEYRARFQMRSPSGELFGTHPYVLIFAVNGTGVCPPSTASLDSFIHLGDRYCFLYPNTHTSYIGAMGGGHVVGPSPGGVEPLIPSVGIDNQGNVAGQNVQQWSTQMINLWKAPATTPATVSTTIGGETAIYTDDLPGIMGNRIVFVVHNNIGFAITVFPVDGSVPSETADALDLWETIRGSFVFFGP